MFLKINSLLYFFILFFPYSLAAQQLSSSESIHGLNQQIIKPPLDTKLLIKRALLFFESNQHQQSIDDYSEVIKIEPDNYQAYFGRGMALGRIGKVQQGIDDITVYIEHNSKDSVAYTKRGVRYLWLGDNKRAEEDFKLAISIDPENAEAHDDLGVIMAQQNKPEQAISHFLKTIEYEPSYQKAYHNLALTYYIYDNSPAALRYVNKALTLSPDSKDTVILKSEILKSLGQLKLAEALRQDAEFLSDGNWSESMPIQQTQE